MPNVKKSCFAIAPIGPKDSEIRKRSDQVLKHIFKRALTDRYEVTRGDEIDQPGMITSQVLRAVQESDLVVADLTGHNPNVLYELAVRHAIEKPVIHVIQPSLSKIPFDIAGFRTIEFELSDPDSIESAVDQLRKQADAAENGQWGETPVKLANIMQRSQQDSEDTVLLKEAVEGIAEIRSIVIQVNDSMIDLQSRASWESAAAGAIGGTTAEVDTHRRSSVDALFGTTKSFRPRRNLNEMLRDSIKSTPAPLEKREK